MISPLPWLLLLATAVAQEDPDKQPVPASVSVSVEERLDAQAEDIAVLRGQLAAAREALADQQAALEALTRAQRAATETRREPGLVIGSAVIVPAGEVVEDDVVAVGEDVVVRGHVKGDATAFNGNVIVEHGGVITGDAAALGGRVRVEPGGEVHGDRIGTRGAWGMGGELSERGASWLSSLYNRLVFLLTVAGAGILLVGVAPERVARVATAIETRPIRGLFVGSLAGLFFAGASLLFAITIVGLPITFLIWAVLGLAWLLGFVGLCHAVGDKLPLPEGQGRWLTFLLGSAVVTSLTALPWVGGLVVFFGSVLAIGGSLGTWFGRR